ncbi:hypothetical protein GBA52_026744 [Prunus armeniaca]|nr:hypothetical protein GBA52_026744 [Prunus armeniaca]
MTRLAIIPSSAKPRSFSSTFNRRHPLPRLDSVESIFFQVESLPSLLFSTLLCWSPCCLSQILSIDFVVLFLLGESTSLVVALV